MKTPACVHSEVGEADLSTNLCWGHDTIRLVDPAALGSCMGPGNSSPITKVQGSHLNDMDWGRSTTCFKQSHKWPQGPDFKFSGSWVGLKAHPS